MPHARACYCASRGHRRCWQRTAGSCPDGGARPRLRPRSAAARTRETPAARPSTSRASNGGPPGKKPDAAHGFTVAAFAAGLDHPRWLYVLPNGDVLVAETNAPPKETTGLKDFAMKQVQKIAGAGPQSPNRITLLRDADGDGKPETRTVFLTGLYSPFGMALVGNDFYVANADAVLRFPYQDGRDRRSPRAGTKLTDLPAGPINHHWTKNLVASPDGSKLYVAVGSNSNVGENGIEAEDRPRGDPRDRPRDGPVARLRFRPAQPGGLAWQPQSGALWTAVNERDELGDDLVPDYITSVRDGAFYGWPYSYYGAHVDERVDAAAARPGRQGRRARLRAGLAHRLAGPGFYQAERLPRPLPDGAFVGQHGSWNRSERSGYKVIFVPVRGRQAIGPAGGRADRLPRRRTASARPPVGVAVDATGALLVADDVGNVIWRVSAAKPVATRQLPGEAPSARPMHVPVAGPSPA